MMDYNSSQRYFILAEADTLKGSVFNEVVYFSTKLQDPFSCEELLG